MNKFGAVLLESPSNTTVVSFILFDNFLSKRRGVGSSSRFGQTSSIRLVQGNRPGCHSRGGVGGAIRRGTETRPLSESLYPSSVAHGDAFPFQQLVLDTVYAFDPPLSVSLATIAAIEDELVAEDSFCRLVAPDFSPLPIAVLEEVARGHDPRLGISDRLYVRAVEARSQRPSCGDSVDELSHKMWYLWISRLMMYR